MIGIAPNPQMQLTNCPMCGAPSGHFELDGITGAERRLAEAERTGTESLDHVRIAKNRSGDRL